jgi:triacylglycerol esterase/lipase EstA (alpha/beta hydrolase family)
MELFGHMYAASNKHSFGGWTSRWYANEHYQTRNTLNGILMMELDRITK